MPAVAAIPLLNGEITPVSHTFTPIGQDSKTNIWWYEDSSPRIATSTAIGFPRLGIRTKREMEQKDGLSAKNTITRVELTFALPTLETLGSASSGFTPAATIAYVDRVKIEFLLSSRDTLGDRKDVLAFSKNLLAHASIASLVNDLQSIY